MILMVGTSDLAKRNGRIHVCIRLNTSISYVRMYIHAYIKATIPISPQLTVETPTNIHRLLYAHLKNGIHHHHIVLSIHGDVEVIGVLAKTELHNQ